MTCSGSFPWSSVFVAAALVAWLPACAVGDDPVAGDDDVPEPEAEPELEPAIEIGTLAAAKSPTAGVLPPTRLTATGLAAQIRLEFDDPSTRETGYAIERGTSPASVFGQIAVVAKDATSFADTGLPASTSYAYRVRAYRDQGGTRTYSAYSPVATATTLPGSGGGDITGPTLSIAQPLPGTTVTTSPVTVSGTAADASGVQRVTVNGVVATGTTSWTASVSLVSGTNTLTVIAADNSTSHNPTTTTITIAYAPPPPPPPPPPSGVSWSRRFGGTGDDRVAAVAVDGAGNSIVTGKYVGAVDFSGTGTVASAVHTSVSYLGTPTPDLFVAKHDAAGNHLWSRSYGNDGSGENGLGLATDTAGNIYVVGVVANGINVARVDFGCTTADYQGAGLNAFVLRLDAEGRCAWVRFLGGNYLETARSIAVDGAGNVYVAGSFESAVNFDGQDPLYASPFRRVARGTLGPIYNGPSSSDGFVMKYGPSGAVQWVRRFGGTSVDGATSLSIDRTDNGVVLTGTFYEGGDFEDSDGTSKLALVGQGDRDSLIVKYTSAGQLAWVIPVATSGMDALGANAVDASGNVWVTGILGGRLMVGKYVGTTRQPAWPTKLFASGSLSQGSSIALDATGVATIGGVIDGAGIDFGGGSVVPLQSDLFAVRYTATGGYVAGSARLYGGAGYQFGYVVALSTGERVLASSFTDFATFGPNTYTSRGSADIVLAREAQ